MSTILILIDAFRHDYLEIHNDCMPFLNNQINNMLKKNEFLTKTIINKFIGNCQRFEREILEHFCDVNHIFNNENCSTEITNG